MNEASKSRAVAQLPTYVVLCVGSFIMLMPLAWMVLTSLKTYDEAIASPPTWMPRHAMWGNYAEALTTFDFGRYLRNSVFVCVMTIAGTLVSCSLGAYAFTCLRARGGDFLFALLLSTLMLPGQVTIIPLFELFVKLGWINTFLPLIVPSWLGSNVPAMTRTSGASSLAYSTVFFAWIVPFCPLK